MKNILIEPYNSHFQERVDSELRERVSNWEKNTQEIPNFQSFYYSHPLLRRGLNRPFNSSTEYSSCMLPNLKLGSDDAWYSIVTDPKTIPQGQGKRLIGIINSDKAFPAARNNYKVTTTEEDRIPHSVPVPVSEFAKSVNTHQRKKSYHARQYPTIEEVMCKAHRRSNSKVSLPDIPLFGETNFDKRPLNEERSTLCYSHPKNSNHQSKRDTNMLQVLPIRDAILSPSFTHFNTSHFHQLAKIDTSIKILKDFH